MNDSMLGDIVRRAASKLEPRSPGVAIVVGIDTHRHIPWGFRGDQAAAAFNASGCIRVTRKVFPVDGDTNEWGRAAYLLDHKDAAGDERFIPLSNGQWGMIALCYDAFAFSELALGPTGKLRAMRYRTDVLDGWAEMIPQERLDWMESLRARIELRRPEVVLNPIHGFRRPGGCRFWQRHGLASASGYLSGALAVGAAHFQTALPAPHESWLAAIDVPACHLHQAQYRKSHALQPIDAFQMRAPRSPLRALVRLFQG